MKTIIKRTQKFSFLFNLILLFSIITGELNAQEYPVIGPGIEKPKTHSPYFIIKSDNPETDRMPLKSTNANVNIAGVIADIQLSQVYKNTGSNSLEAIYVFPASTRAAIYSMKMKIGEREIIAVIQKRESARQQYELAKQNGQTASLLEQERPNVFTMNVANILPGDLIEVELKYTELLVPESGIYEFVYPTVVGPRYNSGGENHSAENWIENPYLREGESPNYSFDINVNLNSGLPIQSLQSKSHEVSIEYKGKHKAEVSLRDKNKFQGNKDFILQYRLTGAKIASGLLLFEGEKENFFLAMIQPPKQIKAENIPPREYIFIIDVSGSMNGFPLDVSKKLLKDLIGGLKQDDMFNILLFAGSSRLYSEKSVEASRENINNAISFLENQRGGGGTELLPALKRGMSLSATEGVSRSFIISTDGYVTVEKEAFEYINKNLGNANFFPFGIGSSVNRHLIEGMAHVGRGEAFIVSNVAEAGPIAEKFRKYISRPVLTNIELQIKDFDTYDVEPSSIPDVFAERPVIVYGKWKGKAEGSIILTGYTGNERYSKTLNVPDYKAAKSNSAIKYLWAREKIRLLDDFIQVSYSHEELKEEVTALGLKYNLLTSYTSFLALDSEIRNANTISTTVRQPLPLPQGVSNYAIGGAPSNGYRKSMRIQGNYKSAPVYEMADAEMEEESEAGTYQIIEKPAEFKGGMDALEKFLKNNSGMPGETKAIVYVQFTVDADGSVKDIKILRGFDSMADKEAVRLIKLTDKMWNPAMFGKKAVKSQLIIPVKF